MAIEIIIDPKYQTMLDQVLLQHTLQITLASVNKSYAELTLKVTGDDEMRQLNQTYRHIDRTTDVLAFDQDYIDPETGHPYLGDVIISFDQVKIQSEDHQRSLHEECARLVIHGTLHLLGYDHAEPQEKKEMWDKQEQLLSLVMESYMENNT